MESNPSNASSNPVYEEINRSVNISTDRGLERKVTERNVIDYNQPKMMTSSNKKIVIAIAVCVSLLALSMVAVAALAIVAYKEITTLQSTVQLQGSPLTNTNQESLGQINEQLDSLQNVVNVLNAAVHTTTSDVNILQSSVDTLNTDRDTTTAQLNSLQSSVDTLNTTTMAQLSNLQSSVDTLNTVITIQSPRDTSPVNLYENCIQETSSCLISPTSYNVSWRACITAPYIPINSTVSVHIWIQDFVCWGWDCIYRSKPSKYNRGPIVMCVCHVRGGRPSPIAIQYCM